MFDITCAIPRSRAKQQKKKYLSEASFRIVPTQAGDSLPSATVFEGSPDGRVNIKDVFGDKTGVLFAVPGAFTPSCSKSHLPGYINDYEKFAKAGAEVIACVAVNDPFVVTAWGEANKADGKVRMLADTQLELTKALGVEFDATGFLGSVRSKRYSAVIKNGKFKTFNLEPDGGGLSCSLAPTALEQLSQA